MITKELINEIGGKITPPKNKYYEVKVPIFDEYTISFFVVKLPVSFNDLSMIFIHKGRNKDINIPMRKGKFLYDGEDTFVIDILLKAEELLTVTNKE